MARRIVFACASLLGGLALAGLLAGCSLFGSKTVTKAGTPGRTPSAVRIGVVDGDLRKRVRGAVVHIRHFKVRTNRKGWARIPLRHRGKAVVTVTKRGYDPLTTRLQLSNRPRVGVEIYQSKLQWRIYGATPSRTQAHPAIHLRPPFRIVWAKPVGGLIEFPAVVDHGVAYIGNQRGAVKAFSMRDGTLLWRRRTKNTELAASPAVYGRFLVVHGMDGYVYLRNRVNGRLLWRYSAGSAIESSPVVRNGIDYFGTWNGNVYAVDLRRHRVRWVFRSGYKITSSASFGGGTLYIGDYGGRLLALYPRTGRLRWSSSVNGRIYGTPAFAHGRVFVPSSDGRSMTAFSSRGRRLWSIGTGAYVYSSPAVWGGRVFFGSYNGVLYCVSARNGAVRWRFSTGGAISGAVIVVAGVVYAGNFSHRIYGVSARTGRQLLSFPHGDYVPVSGNGGRLLFHGFSRLFAVQPRHRR
jgi:outer membrane protein assembly factor BamB